MQAGGGERKAAETRLRSKPGSEAQLQGSPEPSQGPNPALGAGAEPARCGEEPGSERAGRSLPRTRRPVSAAGAASAQLGRVPGEGALQKRPRCRLRIRPTSCRYRPREAPESRIKAGFNQAPEEFEKIHIFLTQIQAFSGEKQMPTAPPAPPSCNKTAGRANSGQARGKKKSAALKRGWRSSVHRGGFRGFGESINQGHAVSSPAAPALVCASVTPGVRRRGRNEPGVPSQPVADHIPEVPFSPSPCHQHGRSRRRLVAAHTT